jgi:hypothetical protein
MLWHGTASMEVALAEYSVGLHHHALDNFLYIT